MTPDQILDQLAIDGPLPADALRAASRDRAVMAPILIEQIERHLAGEHRPTGVLFFAFHLLGDWREKAAYPTLIRLLRCPGDEVEAALGEAATETSHRVVAAVFDGDPRPLYDLILDPAADEFVRAAMCEVIGISVRRQLLPRDEAARFLARCFHELRPRKDCFVWQGWADAIAMVGLEELKPVVMQAYSQGRVHSSWSGFNHFEKDLRDWIGDPSHRGPAGANYELFGDTVEEFSTWYGFTEEAAEARRRFDSEEAKAKDLRSVADSLVQPPAVNLLKGIGRNDPCPCGSGKKFKKCCLEAPRGEAIYNDS